MTLPPGLPGRTQLTLAFPLRSQSRFSNFIATGNEELVRRLLTTGLAGVAFYLLLFTGLVFFGLQRLGLLPTPGRRRTSPCTTPGTSR